MEEFMNRDNLGNIEASLQQQEALPLSARC